MPEEPHEEVEEVTLSLPMPKKNVVATEEITLAAPVVSVDSNTNNNNSFRIANNFEIDLALPEPQQQKTISPRNPPPVKLDVEQRPYKQYLVCSSSFFCYFSYFLIFSNTCLSSFTFLVF